jgi:hypothetical protein
MDEKQSALYDVNGESHHTSPRRMIGRRPGNNIKIQVCAAKRRYGQRRTSYTTVVPYDYNNIILYHNMWAVKRSRYSDWLWAGRSGDRIPLGARFSALVQTGTGFHPTSCTIGTVSFPGIKSGLGVTLTPHPLLVPWSWKSRAMPLFPLWAVRPVQSLSACSRVHFTFTFTFLYHNIIIPLCYNYLQYSFHYHAVQVCSLGAIVCSCSSRCVCDNCIQSFQSTTHLDYFIYYLVLC